MASSWRIRHKLMVGLGLVVGILLLLLTGTLKGLLSYSNTMKSIDSKLAELQEAEKLKIAVGDLLPPSDRSYDDELGWLEGKKSKAYEALKAYHSRLIDTIQRRRDPDRSHSEKEFVKALIEEFKALDRGIAALRSTPEVRMLRPSERLLDDPRIAKPSQALISSAACLRDVIYSDLYKRITEARGEIRTSLTIVITTTVTGVLLMIGMLRFFYCWVFFPVRDLQLGAGRVAEGDFDHRIEVHSGDEMEDLAAAFNDMTGRLREMYRDLAHQVNERSRQLVRSERLASVGFLAAGVAHEINNPLASIAFCSEALESRLADALAQAPTDSEIITKYLRMIQQEAFRCKTITQRLLEFSRTGERRREPSDLSELVRGVLDMVEHLQNYKGKHIVFEPPGRLVAWVNTQEIKSVVLNLVVNALESMDEGGTLTITLGQRDRNAELVFADSGCGMSDEVLENIFEPFFTRSRTGKGTGLGLSISHRIITQHGGEIEAVSPGLNRGSTFTVRLPLQPAESMKEESLAHAAA